MGVRVGGWMDEWTEGWMGEWMGGGVERWMDGWRDANMERDDGWIV